MNIFIKVSSRSSALALIWDTFHSHILPLHLHVPYLEKDLLYSDICLFPNKLRAIKTLATSKS